MDLEAPFLHGTACVPVVTPRRCDTCSPLKVGVTVFDQKRIASPEVESDQVTFGPPKSCGTQRSDSLEWSSLGFFNLCWVW